MSSVAPEEARKKSFGLFRFYMNPHLVVFLAEKKYMIPENKRYHLVELENSVDAAYQETPEGVELIKVIQYYLVVKAVYLVEFLKFWQEIVKLQRSHVAVWFPKFLVYFTYDSVSYHTPEKFKLIQFVFLFKLRRRVLMTVPYGVSDY